MTETAFVERARRGDEAAWESLVREHQAGVFRLAYLLTGDPDEAEDVAQEAFIRAYRALDRFEAGRPLRPWLLRIAKNVASNRRRAGKRYRAALGRAARASPEPVMSSAEDTSDEARRATQLWEAVQQLARKDREVILLRYFLDLPVSETAEALDVAEGTVKSRTARALARLKEVVKRDFAGLYEGYAGHE